MPVMKSLAVSALALLTAFSPIADAQQNLPANGLLLVAKPTIRDPTFARTVVLVSQTEDGSTVGVILNRPTTLKLAQFLSGEFDTTHYKDPIYFGGPVMRQALVMVFRAEAEPVAAAFHVLKNVYLTMHPDNVAAMLADPAARYRVYAGFSGWSPNQLQSELERDGWYFLQADEDTLFRKTSSGMWEELLERAKKSDARGRS
jgi:putative transcriptional regulator